LSYCHIAISPYPKQIISIFQGYKYDEQNLFLVCCLGRAIKMLKSFKFAYTKTKTYEGKKYENSLLNLKLMKSLAKPNLPDMQKKATKKTATKYRKTTEQEIKKNNDNTLTSSSAACLSTFLFLLVCWFVDFLDFV